GVKSPPGPAGPAPYEPAATLEPQGKLSTDTERLIAQAIAQRPERRALADRVDAAGARMEAAKAGLLPQLAFNGGYDYARPNPRIFPRSGQWEDSWDLSVKASWTLWGGGR